MRTAAILGVPVLLLVACASTSGPSAPPPTPEGTVVSPTTGGSVAVALAAARLGEENCTHDESTDTGTKSCAANPDAGAPRGTGLCGGPCVFSNVQLTFTANASAHAEHVQIVSVTLIDASTGQTSSR